jgi:hypothetical protein
VGLGADRGRRRREQWVVDELVCQLVDKLEELKFVFAAALLVVVALQ